MDSTFNELYLISALITATMFVLVIISITTSRRVKKIASGNIIMFENTYWTTTVCVKSHLLSENIVQIGCEKRSISQWDYFFSDESEEIINNYRDSIRFNMIKKDYLFAREKTVELFENIYR